jgi:hypothetical protein
MIRCVAIHANGTSEVLEFRPQVHQELRHLGYRRFVVRTADGRALSSAVYARTTPSTWQFSDAAKKLWGLAGEVQALDEHGEPVTDTLTPANGIASVPSGIHARVTQPASGEGKGASAVRMAGVDRETPARSKTRIDPSQLPELIARANHSLPETDPRKITRSLVGDLLRAARAIRLDLDVGPGAPGGASDRRDLADRLDAYARALDSYLRPRPDDDAPLE